ncbi:MAG: hypothetical protein FWG09_04920 [Synergistaceae bacterium]|nr:hypothetical protein [Synergistaceae bacterium]
MSDILNTFNSDEIASITALIDKLEQSSFDYMKLESEGKSITIGKNGVIDAAGSPAAPATAPIAVKPPPVKLAAADTAAQADAPLAETPAAKAVVPEQEGIFIIKSPSYGLFYAQPEPGAPTYVSVGAIINADDTIGLMEIMKTFSAITSPVSGEVVAIHVKNEETLEPGQALVSVKVK